VGGPLRLHYFWRNLGGFRFEEVGHLLGVAGNAAGGYQAGMGVACGDLDGDGRPDPAVTNFYGESTTLYSNLGNGSNSPFAVCTSWWEAGE
jgi:enediyne biosynthesis protein E4